MTKLRKAAQFFGLTSRSSLLAALAVTAVTAGSSPSARRAPASCVAGAHTAIAASPTAIATSPSAIATSPTAIATSPSAIAASPTTIAASPTAIATSPSASPSAFTARPIAIAVSPSPIASAAGSSAIAARSASATPAGSPVPGRAWRIEGNLSEACTCSVPCSCNFGGAPSPHHYCWAIFSLDIQKGRYGEVALDGLHLACGNGSKGSVWYLDERAGPQQAAALRAIADAINAKLVGYWRGVDPKIVADPQFRQLGFKTARIVQQAGDRGSLLRIGDFGSFESVFLLGIDGISPIVVENNWSWNIRHGIKGKTKQLKYKDAYGNLIDAAGTNANQGTFDWSDRTAIYLR